MIDIHSHILPGLDDGAMDLFDSIEMIHLAAESGTRAMVATPHCNLRGMFDNYFGEEYIEAIHRVQEAVKKEHLPVEIYPGAEAFATWDLPDKIVDGKVMPINQSRYILMEFDFQEDPEFADAVLERVKEVGAKPVIAHAERYAFVQDDLQMAYEWRKKGYLIQVNKGSFQGRFGRSARRAAYQLMDHNLVTAVASDAHRPDQRTPYMRDVYELLREEYSKKYLSMIFEENPRRICDNQATMRFELIPFEEEY